MTPTLTPIDTTEAGVDTINRLGKQSSGKWRIWLKQAGFPRHILYQSFPEFCQPEVGFPPTKSSNRSVLWLSRPFGEAKQIGRRHVARGLKGPSQRPLFKAAIAHKSLQARHKRLPGGGSLLATNLDHQKLGRAEVADKPEFRMEVRMEVSTKGVHKVPAAKTKLPTPVQARSRPASPILTREEYPPDSQGVRGLGQLPA